MRRRLQIELFNTACSTSGFSPWPKSSPETSQLLTPCEVGWWAQITTGSVWIMETFFCKAPQFLPPFPSLRLEGNIIYRCNPSKAFGERKRTPLKCSLFFFFPESVCFCCLDFPWWQRTKRSTVEQFQQSQTQCLYREFLSLAQTHRPTAKKDKVNHRLCFLLACRPVQGPCLTPPLALLWGAGPVDLLRWRGWKMRRPSRRIFYRSASSKTS